MSEELNQNNYTKNGDSFGQNFESYNIGATSIQDLAKYNIIPKKDYGNYNLKKPDRLIVDRRNLEHIRVVCVIEYKIAEEFNTDKKRKDAFEQCNNYCQELGATFGIITDTVEYVYINPKINPDLAEHTYVDDYGETRNYSLIKDDSGYDLTHRLVSDLGDEASLESSLAIFDRIDKEITSENSKFTILETINPSNLANAVHQTIWLASGENPDKCLSTFVEIFIFRFLSDLGVLTTNKSGAPVDFSSVFNIEKDACLRYYFSNVRTYIKELFPISDHDGTSIINGFILDKENTQHNHIFHDILTKFDDFLTGDDGEAIRLQNIDPDFKSRLYEDFLKSSISQKNWGQFFTPRNVIKAIIEVSGIENLDDGAIVCDPACGVGGFLLEPLLGKINNNFSVKDGKLTSRIIFQGADRDPNVINMAKANLLIYISEILRDNPGLTKEFANQFNNIFKSFHSSSLGSLQDTNSEIYDLVLSNPPYVTKGISNYKKAIKEDGNLKEYYRISGMGTECFFVEKIINELKPGAKAIIVLPDGILNRQNDDKIRKFIKKYCIIEGLVSLPEKTFYTTLKKTYILIITKKNNQENVQEGTFFTYLVSNIGESLDIYRSPTDSNDLVDFVRQFKYFQLDKELFKPLNLRCKVFPITKLDPKLSWCVDKWWDVDELDELGIEEKVTYINVEEYIGHVDRITKEIISIKQTMEKIDTNIAGSKVKTESLPLSSLFEIIQGNAYYTKKRIKNNSWQGEIPVYSSDTKNQGIMMNIAEDRIKSGDKYYDYSLTWAIDGINAGHIFLRNVGNKENSKEKQFLYTMNNHSGVLIPRQKIDFCWQRMLRELRTQSSAKKSIMNSFVNELELCYQKLCSSTEKDEVAEVYNKFFSSLVIDCEVNEKSLESFKDRRLAKPYPKLGELKRGGILSDEVIQLLLTSDISSIKIYPVNEEVSHDFDSNLKINMTYLDGITDITGQIFAKELLPFIKNNYDRRINIDLGYIKKVIQPIFFMRTRAYGNKKLGTNQIKDIIIEVPICDDGSFDLEYMGKISNEEDKLLSAIKDIKLKIREIEGLDVQFVSNESNDLEL